VMKPTTIYRSLLPWSLMNAIRSRANQLLSASSNWAEAERRSIKEIAAEFKASGKPPPQLERRRAPTREDREEEKRLLRAAGERFIALLNTPLILPKPDEPEPRYRPKIATITKPKAVEPRKAATTPPPQPPSQPPPTIVGVYCGSHGRITGGHQLDDEFDHDPRFASSATRVWHAQNRGARL
jgi:hypothetical protein